MAIKSDSTHWGSLAKTFHWFIVLLILVQATVGLTMVELPKRPNVIPIYTFHKSLGLTILLLAILRFGWRAFDRRPLMPDLMPHWQVLTARAGHALLYGLLFAVPLSGWWFDSASSLRPLYLWGVVHLPNLTGADKHLAEITRNLHHWLFWALALVALGHAAAALVHHYFNHDDVLRRMLPNRRAKRRD